MKKIFIFLMLLSSMTMQAQYVPTPENIQARQQFDGFRFGIFLHWGIYSEFAQGEWYLNTGKLNKDEYAKAASCFYPILFDANQWIKAIKASGAKYITFTSRHHDSFSMYKTNESQYNIVDATPFKRDVLKELAAACQKEGIQFHLYYSILDWIREDYPIGRTGHDTGRTPRPNYNTYFQFMKNQVKELLTNYPNVAALWFDGYWDHNKDVPAFDWRLPEFYRYIHALKPECLIGNNHHTDPIEGEDFQMFERDLPGENKAGLSPQGISELPLEMCQTMNGMWGYKVADQDYKSVDELVTLIINAAAKGCNLLLNIGPQPNGELPALAIDRLQGIGKWMNTYGETIYGTHRGIDDAPWGVTTKKGNTTFIHVLSKQYREIEYPQAKRPKLVKDFLSGNVIKYKYDKKKKTVIIPLDGITGAPDRVVTMIE